jgi:hypothetical protein
MADVHIAESRLVQYGYKPDNHDFRSEYMFNVMVKAGVDTTRFNESFKFYSSHPAYFHDMYEEVITEISKRQAGHK